jgi:sugar phosphate isomerase/epimerase
MDDAMSGDARLLAGPLGDLVATGGRSVREALEHLRALGFAGVQWSATLPEARPRDLGASARRDLKAVLRRFDLRVSGIDLWVPPEHFVDASRVDRAVAATVEAIGLAGDLGRCPLSLRLPAVQADGDAVGGVLDAILATAERSGVAIADHADPACADPRCGIGIDPVAEFAAGRDPVAVVFERAGRIVAARLCDLTRSGLRAAVGGGGGEGRLDTLRYRVALEVAGFHGMVVVDARQWAEIDAGLRRSIEVWREAGRPAAA